MIGSDDGSPHAFSMIRTAVRRGLTLADKPNVTRSPSLTPTAGSIAGSNSSASFTPRKKVTPKPTISGDVNSTAQDVAAVC